MLDWFPIVAIFIALILALLVVWSRLRRRSKRAARWAGISALVLLVLIALPTLRLLIGTPYFLASESMVPSLLIHDHVLVNKLVYHFSTPSRGDIVLYKAPRMASPAEKEFVHRAIGLPGDVVRITPGYVTVDGQNYTHSDLRSSLVSMSKGLGSPLIRLESGRVLVNGREISLTKIAAALGEPKAKVKITPGVVYLNGKPLDEPYVAEDPDEPYPGGRGYVDPKWIVEDGEHQKAVKIPKGRLLVMGDNRNMSNDSRFWGLLDERRVRGKAVLIFSPADRFRWLK